MKPILYSPPVKAVVVMTVLLKLQSAVGSEPSVFVDTNFGWPSYIEEAELSESPKSGSSIDGNEGLGTAVGIFDGTAVASAPREKWSNGSSGASRVFERSAGWANTQILQVSGVINDAGRGYPSCFNVAIDKNSLAIGSPGDSLDHTGYVGAVYVYAPDPVNDWRMDAWLIDYNKFQDNLGCSVALSGTTLLAGGPAGVSGSASVFVLDPDGWSKQAEFDDPDKVAPPGQVFGEAVALFQDIAVVGRPISTAGTSSAYIYRRSGGSWALQQTLIPVGRSSLFGASVGVWGDTVVVGDSFGGTVYIYQEVAGSWVLKQTLSPNQPVNGMFGYAVSIDGDRLLIGRPLVNRAYLFQKKEGTWQSRNAFGDDGDRADAFGAAVAVSADEIIIGAPGSPDGGHAYIFRDDEIFRGTFE